MKNRVKQVDLAIYALYLALFKVYLIPQAIQQLMKMVLLVYVFCFVISHISKKDIVNLTLFFGIEIILSGILSYIHGSVGLHGIYNGILYALCLYLTYSLMAYCGKINYFKELINCLYRITSIICFISLISMGVEGHSKHGSEILYFFGYKFMTSYFFIFWAALFRIKYYIRIKKDAVFKTIYFFIICSVILICRWLYCSTALLASLFLFVELFIPNKAKKFIMNKKATLIAVCFAGVIPFVVKSILNNQIIQYIVKNILHKSLNLTGRVRIFENLAGIISDRFWTGYGYGNAIVEEVVGYGNAQNGLMQLFVNFGIAGVMLFIIIIYQALKFSDSYKYLNGLYIILYALIICATVEISYNYMFFLTLFIIGAFSKRPSCCRGRITELDTSD